MEVKLLFETDILYVYLLQLSFNCSAFETVSAVVSCVRDVTEQTCGMIFVSKNVHICQVSYSQ